MVSAAGHLDLGGAASGGGSVNSSGLYTSPGSGTLVSVTAASGTVAVGSGTVAGRMSCPCRGYRPGYWLARPCRLGLRHQRHIHRHRRRGADDIGNASDQFHYVYQTLSGDGMILARVGTQQNTVSQYGAEAGVMIRNSTAAGDSERQ